MSRLFAKAAITAIGGGVALKAFSVLMNEYRPGFGTAINSQIESFVLPTHPLDMYNSFCALMGNTAGDMVGLYMIILNSCLIIAGLQIIGGLFETAYD